jgi:nitroreductase
MDVKEAINRRRAYRSLEDVEITDEFIKDLAGSAQLSPSCFNNQPWRYVFVHDREMLLKLHEALSRGNAWAKSAPLIIAVFSKPELDCQIKERNYYLFDTGMATAFIILRATALGLVAHPIAGFDEGKVKEILDIPDDMEVITLVIVGKRMTSISPVLTEEQVVKEKQRPERKPLEEFAHLNRFREG